ncbi:MAG TPA: LacI family transcriptional regulator [Firmicutes bacterium]|nr:LacI family transcriptional regulator [Bacillota bacterium]
MTTIKDVAKRVGVSPSVVSRALNNRYGVKESTREKIVRAAKEMGYYPNAAARSLVTRITATIGVMMADLSEPYYTQIIRGMEFSASKTGYTLLFSNSYESLEKSKVLEKMVYAERVDGVIIVGSNVEEQEYILKLVEKKVPFVLLERDIPDPRINCVYLDNFYGGYLATKYLLDKGHTRIAHISGKIGFQVALDRLEGYKKALHEAGLLFDKELVMTGNFVWQDGYAAMKKLLRSQPPCTAVFTANDTMAFGALQAIAESGLSIPKDIAVIGFDDLEFSSLTNPPLTTVHQPRYEMGKEAVRIVTSLLQQGASEKGVKLCYRPEIIIRRSA